MTEPWIEQVIRKAQAEGKLDVTNGAGKPIADLDRPYDPGWWARRWVRIERVREQAIELTRRVERELPRILSGADAAEMRAGLEGLNTEIDVHNQSHDDELPLLDVEGLIAERAGRFR